MDKLLNQVLFMVVWVVYDLDQLDNIRMLHLLHNSHFFLNHRKLAFIS